MVNRDEDGSPCNECVRREGHCIIAMLNGRSPNDPDWG
jgi:hypothetical protein